MSFIHIRKLKVFVLLKSKLQQVGKGNLLEFLINFVFGKHCSVAVNGLDKMLGKHNTVLQNKIFIGINEIPTAEKQFYKAFDTLKSMITDPTMDIEPKGIDSYTLDSYLNFIGCTNHQKPIHLEQGDARYCIIDVNESKRGDFEYWNDMNKNVFTEENGKQFFSYLKNLPIENIVELRNIPMTKTKETMMTNSMNSMELFISRIKERDSDIKLIIEGTETKNAWGGIISTDISKIRINTEFKVSKYNLYEAYKDWCHINNENVMKQKYFNDIIPEYRESNGRFHRFY